MLNDYGILLTIHLLCVVVFVGAVSFEVLAIEKKLPPEMDEKLAEPIPAHVREFMPVVGAILMRPIVQFAKGMFYLSSTADILHSLDP